ncbi:hypothetical protein E1258_07505 [Micromonospora sp. KC207]|uniref:hypothetical protein n=1 Tax=Micromonospora sp. KC207 TaxID=2530377 RepID=UPI0010470FFA|nr:hypothetical protein [Micromonospora sp. KC207]TDC64737.1 hypothetical protein E1258_07505 [Micromonospora sp. KC207]
MTPLRRTVLAGAAMWLCGFGALLVFWSRWEPLAGGPPLLGLFDFLSATWGDGLLLPVAAAALTHSHAVLPPARRDVAVTGLAAAAGALAGVSTQVQWLRDDNPVPNWTFPAPHQFTAAGWYHAVFLVAACAAFGGLWVAVLYRYGTSRFRSRERRRVVPALALAALAQLCFLALLAADDRRTNDASMVTAGWASPASLPGPSS